MRFLVACITLSVIALLALTTAHAAPPKPPKEAPPTDDASKYGERWVNAARWEFKTEDDGDKVAEDFKGTTDGKVTHKGKEIGTWQTKSKTECVMEITKGEMKGTMKFTQTKEDEFHGEWTPAGAKTARKVMVKLVHN